MKNILDRYYLLSLSIFLLFACATAGYQDNKVTQTEDTYPAIDTEERKLLDVKVENLDDKERVIIEASDALTYTAFGLTDPSRIMLYILDVDSGDVISPIKVEDGIINLVKIDHLENTNQTKVEIGLNLNNMADYDVSSENNFLYINVLKTGLIEEEIARAEMPPQEAETQPLKPEIISGEKKEVPTAAKLLDIIVEKNEGAIKFIFKSDHKIKEYNSFTLFKPSRIVFDLPNTTSGLTRSSIPIDGSQIKEIRIGKYPEKLRCVFDVNQEKIPDFDMERLGEDIVLTVKMPAILAEIKTGERVETKEIEKVKSEEKAVLKGDVEIVTGKDKKYSGTKISLDFKEADIQNILRLIAEVSGYNIVLDEDVKGKITLRLVDVPWDQSLDLILETKALGMIKIGNVIKIAKAEKIKKAEEAALFAKRAKEKLEDLATELIPVNYATASAMSTQVSKILTERGTVSVDDRTNKLIISDISRAIEEAKKLVRSLDTPTPQVMIEAKIVQTNPSTVKEMGISWTEDNIDLDANKSRSSFAVLNLPAPAGPGSGGTVGFSLIEGSNFFDVELTALEKQDKVKIISNPKILGIDNTTAKIKQGVALPYLKLSEQGVTSTEFKDAVLELEVTPHITPDKSVYMVIKVKKDQKSAQTGAGGEPGIDIREAQTECL
ncbi:MAG: type IV pilus secretin PilQ, partial [Thermodesulfobacteriota bacterium]|nr:type IV pilus secretin PilQ [Thermodesulfobacteriota bacterium]